MKNMSSYPRTARQKHRFALLVALFVVVLGLGAFPVIQALADAGPFPTRTPTITLTPQPSPTQLLITLTPTITLVPTPTELVLEQEQPLEVIVLTPTPPPGGRSLFACWPLALILIVAIIIASTYFLTRYSSQSQPIE